MGDLNYNFYGYLGKPLAGNMAIANGVNDLCCRLTYEKGLLPDVLGILEDGIARCIKLNTMLLENGLFMDDVIAEVSMIELSRLGLELSGQSQRIKKQLIASYLFNSGLVYIEQVRGGVKRSFFITKNIDVVIAMQELLDDDSRKKLRTLRDTDYVTNYQDINTGVFTCVVFVPETKGFKLSRAKINIFSKDTRVIMPMYVLGAYNDTVVAGLVKHRFKITYRDESGRVRIIHTTLNQNYLKSWVGKKNARMLSRVLESVQDKYVLGNIIIPDLQSRNKEFVTLSLFDILRFEME